MFDNPASLNNRPSKGDCLASMGVSNKSGCTVLYFFKMYNLGGGVWIPYREAYIQYFGRISMLYAVSVTSGMHDQMVRLIMPKTFENSSRLV